MTNLLPRPRASGTQVSAPAADTLQTVLRGHGEAKEKESSPRSFALRNIGVCLSASRLTCDGHAGYHYTAHLSGFPILTMACHFCE